jgi:hypothetical protein
LYNIKYLYYGINAVVCIFVEFPATVTDKPLIVTSYSPTLPTILSIPPDPLTYQIDVDGPFCSNKIKGEDCNYKLDFKINGLGDGDPYSFSYYECSDCGFKSQEFSEINEEDIKETVIKKLEAKQRRGKLVNKNSYE